MVAEGHLLKLVSPAGNDELSHGKKRNRLFHDIRDGVSQCGGGFIAHDSDKISGIRILCGVHIGRVGL